MPHCDLCGCLEPTDLRLDGCIADRQQAQNNRDDDIRSAVSASARAAAAVTATNSAAFLVQSTTPSVVTSRSPVGVTLQRAPLITFHGLDIRFRTAITTLATFADPTGIISRDDVISQFVLRARNLISWIDQQQQNVANRLTNQFNVMVIPPALRGIPIAVGIYNDVVTRDGQYAAFNALRSEVAGGANYGNHVRSLLNQLLPAGNYNFAAFAGISDAVGDFYDPGSDPLVAGSIPNFALYGGLGIETSESGEAVDELATETATSMGTINSNFDRAPYDKALSDYNTIFDTLCNKYCQDCQECPGGFGLSKVRQPDGTCQCPDGYRPVPNNPDCCERGKKSLNCEKNNCSHGCAGCRQTEQASSSIDAVTGQLVESAFCIDDPDWQPQPPAGGCTGGREWDSSGCGSCECPEGTELYDDPVTGEYCREVCGPGQERVGEDCVPICGQGFTRNSEGVCIADCDPVDAPICSDDTEAECNPEDGTWECVPIPCPETAPRRYQGSCWDVCDLAVELGATEDELIALACIEVDPCPADDEPECPDGQHSECGEDGWTCADDEDQDEEEEEEEDDEPPECAGCQELNADGTRCVDPDPCARDEVRDEDCDCVARCPQECTEWDGDECAKITSADCPDRCADGEVVNPMTGMCEEIDEEEEVEPEDVNPCPDDEKPRCPRGQSSQCTESGWRCVNDITDCPDGYQLAVNVFTGANICEVVCPCGYVPNPQRTACIELPQAAEFVRNEAGDCVRRCPQECTRWDGSQCAQIISARCPDTWGDGEVLNPATGRCEQIRPPEAGMPEIPDPIVIAGVTLCPRNFRLVNGRCVPIQVDREDVEPPCVRELSIARDWREVLLERPTRADDPGDSPTCRSLRPISRRQFDLGQFAEQSAASGLPGERASGIAWIIAQRSR